MALCLSPSPWRCDIWSHISLPAPYLKQTKMTLTRPAVLRGREPTKPGLWVHLQLNTLLMAVGGDTCVPHVPSQQLEGLHLLPRLGVVLSPSCPCTVLSFHGRPLCAEGLRYGADQRLFSIPTPRFKGEG